MIKKLTTKFAFLKRTFFSVSQLDMNDVFVYDSSLKTRRDYVNRTRSASDQPKQRIANLTSASGTQFTSFSKSSKYGKGMK